MLLITGRKGQLGTTLSQLLPTALCTDIEELDITDPLAVQKFVEENNIDAIVNCAAYTNVDKAEDEPDLAYKVNVIGAKNLAATGRKMIHISTDYVFDGQKTTPYLPTDPPNPLNVYGKTKWQGELEVLKNPLAVIIRTSWLYSPYGKNFVKTMLQRGRTRDKISVVNDQIGSPTCAHDLATAIKDILPQISDSTAGIYHYTNDGQCSWYEFAKTITEIANLPCKVIPVSTKEFPTTAIRPRYSVLDKATTRNIINQEILTWEDSIKEWIPRFF